MLKEGILPGDFVFSFIIAQPAEVFQRKEEKKDEGSKKIDFDGLESRVVRLPIPSENYSSLSCAGDFLFFVQEPEEFYGRDRNGVPKLKSFDLKNQKLNTFFEDFSGYAISADGKKLLTQ